MSLSSRALLRTIPEEDYCGFFEKGVQVKPKKVIDFLKYKRKDVAVAANINLDHVRYEDKKMPQELQDRLTEWATAINLVAGFFKNNQDKTMLWFAMPNPLLGGISPRDMIRIGRFKKLLNFIQTALNENQRDHSSEPEKDHI